MRFNKIVIAIALFTYASVFAQIALIKKSKSILLKTSVIIPCVPKHVQHLKELLHAYACQTVVPDEMVIALSQCDDVSKNELHALQTYSWPFIVKIIKTKKKCSAGANRNRAYRHATGDLILAQDADDIPHPQKIELIKYIFEHYKVDHMLHGWVPSVDEFVTYKKNNVCAYYCVHLDRVKHHIHHANVCALRMVFQKVKWPEHFEVGEDVQFNKAVYKQFKHTAIIYADLIAYRSELSSWRKLFCI